MAQPLELGPFVLVDRIGSGAMGTVYHAFHGDSGARVAVKVLRPEAAREPAARDQLEAEIRAVALLDHPHIVRIYDVGRVDAGEAERSEGRLVADTAWFAMELTSQGSLQQRMRGLDGAELLELLSQLLSALAHAHARGILHLDLKPANVLFGGRVQGALLADFGMGLVGAPDPGADVIRGTPHFMAPEQVRGRWEELGPWTDLYALGNLAWVVATGRPPMPEGTPHQVLEAQLTVHPGPFESPMELPPRFEGWVRRLLDKDPARRFAFAADASRALLEACDGAAPPRIPEDWRVSELEGAAEVSEATGLGLAVLREPPLVGRTRERSVLWRALQQAAQGRPRVVVLRGPAGSGKSRVGRWLGVRAHELGAGIALATGQEGGGGGGLLQALRRAFPVDLRDFDAEPGLASRLRERGLQGPMARQVAAWLAKGVVEVRTSGPEAWWTLAAAALRAVGAERLPVWFADDVHLDVPTLRFVRWALSAGGLPPSVVVLGVEEESLLAAPEADALLKALEPLPGCETVVLGELSEQARSALASRLLPLEPSLASEVAERAAGSPLYAVELVQDLAGRGALERGPMGLKLREGATLSSPPQLASVWKGHLDAVLSGHPEWEGPLEVAAVLGPKLDLDLWAEACGFLGRPAPRALLVALVHSRLARPGPPGLRFVHPMMCDALAEQIQDPAVFRACAEVLEGRDDARCAAAWLRAGALGEALDAWLRAARPLRGGEPGKLEAVVAHLREAADDVLTADDPRWIDVHDLCARLAADRGRVSEAGAAASRLWDSARDDRSLFLAHVAMARASMDLLDQPGSLRHLEAAADLWRAGGVPPADQDLARSELVGLGVELGRVADAERWAQGGAPGLLDLARAWLALARGDVRRAESLGHRLGEGDDLRILRARAALCEGYAELLAGRNQEALTAWQAARRRFRSLGHVSEVVASCGLAIALDRLGKEEDALHVLAGLQARTLGPRLALCRSMAEVVVRISRPHDMTWNGWWRSVRQGLETASALHPGDAAWLRSAVGQAARPDRARELEELLASKAPRVQPELAR